MGKMTELVMFRCDKSGIARLTFKQTIDQMVVKRIIDIDLSIKRGLLKEKTGTGPNFTVDLLVFQQHVISSLIHEKVWFPKQKI